MDVRKVIAIFLEHQGYDAAIATSAEHALSLLDQQKFDLLLTDVIMPDMKGPDLYAARSRVDPSISRLP